MFTICWESKYKRAAKNTPAITVRVERKKKIEEFIIDETLIKIGSELIWLWVGLESKEILGIRISKERNILLAEQFISSYLSMSFHHKEILKMAEGLYDDLLKAVVGNTIYPPSPSSYVDQRH